MWFTVFFPSLSPDILLEGCSTSSQTSVTTAHIWASLWGPWFPQFQPIPLLYLGPMTMAHSRLYHHQEKLSSHSPPHSFIPAVLSLLLLLQTVLWPHQAFGSFSSSLILFPISLSCLYFPLYIIKNWCQFNHFPANILSSVATLFHHIYMREPPHPNSILN